MKGRNSISVVNGKAGQRHKTTAPESDASPTNAQISTYNNYSSDNFTSLSQAVLICKR